MTELLSELRGHQSSRRLDPLSAQLQLVRSLTGRHVLLESCDGEIVAHALPGEVSSAVCAAVLTRSAQPLRAALQGSRRVALAAAGPIQVARLDGQVATIVPVPAAYGSGRLWLFGDDVTHVDPLLHGMVQQLAVLASRVAQVEDMDVAAMLNGRAPLPADYLGCHAFLLVARAELPSGMAVERLRSAARTASVRLLLHAGVHEGTEIALVICSNQLSLEEVASLLASWAAPQGVRSVLVPWQERGPLQALQQARQALTVADPGCALLADLRSRVFLHAVCEHLGDLAVPGEDPVANLLHKCPDFARALLAWLDAHGDIAAASRAMTCHANTIRYRVRRAGDLLPGDLSDPAFRLEVHLRLIAAMRPATATTDHRSA